MVKSGITKGLMLTAALALSGCGGSSSTPSRPVQSAPTAPAPTSGDQCGAASLQSLVGQPRTSIPVPVEVTNRRVTCATCPMTEDYSPNRLNIIYNRDTGLVARVFCG